MNYAINHKTMMATNRQKLIKILLENKGISRTETSKLLRLTKPSISRIVTDLIRRKFIIEEKVVEPTGNVGKNPVKLLFNPDKKILGLSVTNYKHF